MAKVGAEHNRSLDDFVHEMRKPGLAKKEFCAIVIDFVTRPERFPKGSKSDDLERVRSFIKSKAAAHPLCAKSHVHQAAFSPNGPSIAVTARIAYPKQSAPVNDLLNAIGQALDAATSESDLSSRFAQIRESVNQLSEGEDRAALEAALSVGYSSYIYWQNNLPAFANQFASVYGSCASERRRLGDSGDSALQYCLGGGYTDGAFDGTQNNRTMFFASLTTPRYECDLTWLIVGMKKIAAADAKGAAAGAFAAFRAGGGWNGAVLGGIAGGAFGSIMESIPLVWQAYWCAMW